MQTIVKQSWITLVAMACLTGLVKGDSYRWTGGGGVNNNWSNPANWDVGGSAPGANDDVVFNGSVATTVNIDASNPSVHDISCTPASGWGTFLTNEVNTLHISGVFNYDAGKYGYVKAILAGSGSFVLETNTHASVANALEILNTNNTFSGGTILRAKKEWRLQLGGIGSLGYGPLTLISGCLGNAKTITNAVTLAGNNVWLGWSGDYTTFAGPFTLTGDRLLRSHQSVTFENSGGRLAGDYELKLGGHAQFSLKRDNSGWGGKTIIEMEGDSIVNIQHANALGSGVTRLRRGAIVPNFAMTNPLVFDGDVLLGWTVGVTLNGPVVLTGNRTLRANRDSTINGAISDGSGSFGIVKSKSEDARTLHLTGNNNFKGGILVRDSTLKLSGDNSLVSGGIAIYGDDGIGAGSQNKATCTGVARTDGSPFGDNRVSLWGNYAVLQLDAVNSVNGKIHEILFGRGMPTLYLNDNKSGNWSVGRLRRDGRGVLLLQGSNNKALRANDDLLVQNDAPQNINGMLSPYFIEATADFLRYDVSKGFVRATYNASQLNGAGASDIVKLAAGETLVDDVGIHALRAMFATATTIDGLGYELTVGSGGLLLGNANLASGSLNFGAAEGLIYVDGQNTLAATLKGNNGLTVCGPGTLNLTANSSTTLSGNITVNSGKVRFGSGAALSDGAALHVNSGELDLNDGDLQVSELTLAGGKLVNRGSGTSVVKVSGAANYEAGGMTALLAGLETGGLRLEMQSKPAIFEVADGMMADDLTLDATLVANGGLHKRGAGRLRLGGSTNALSGEILVSRGQLAAASTASGQNPLGQGNRVRLHDAGALGFVAGGTGAGVTLSEVVFGGNGILFSEAKGNSFAVNLGKLSRAERGTLVLQGNGLASSSDHFSNKIVLKVTDEAPGGGNVNNMLPAYFVEAGFQPLNTASDSESPRASGHSAGTARHVYQVASGGDANRIKGLTYGKRSFESVQASDTIDLVAPEQLTSNTEIWALRTQYSIGGSTTLTLGSGGLIINNGDCTIAPALKFGATGNAEALVYVAQWSPLFTLPDQYFGTLAGQLISSIGLTKFGGGTLVLTADNSTTLSGEVMINGGTLRVSDGNALGGSGNGIRIAADAALEIAEVGRCTLANYIAGTGRIITTTNVLVATGTLAPGYTANEIGTLRVDQLELRGSFKWQYNGNQCDRIETANLSFGPGATISCSHVGDERPTSGTFVIFTYRGSDPEGIENLNVVNMNGKLEVDAANKQVLLSIDTVGTLILIK